jgi:hypothetical protein
MNAAGGAFGVMLGGLLVFGIVQQALVAVAFAVVALGAFVHVERKLARDPLLRLGLLTNRSVAGANAFNLLVGAAMASAFSTCSACSATAPRGPGSSSCRSRSA